MPSLGPDPGFSYLRSRRSYLVKKQISGAFSFLQFYEIHIIVRSTFDTPVAAVQASPPRHQERDTGRLHTSA